MSEEQETSMAYVARTKCCNVVRAAVIDCPETQSEIVKSLPRWVRAGLLIERIPADLVGQLWGDCVCNKQARLF